MKWLARILYCYKATGVECGTLKERFFKVILISYFQTYFLFYDVNEELIPNNVPYLCISRYFHVVHRLSSAENNKHTCLLLLPASISFITQVLVTSRLPLR